MPDTAQISSNIISALALSEPTLDTSIGSVTRKIIDAVSGAIAENSNDTHLTTYAYDIDSKTAGALDDFVALFGMARIQAQRAVGTVTFSRTTALATSAQALIPMGTQITSNTDPPVPVTVMASVVMATNQTTIDVPVQAINAGPTGNVAANTLITPTTTLNGISSVTNTLALSGGSNQETDEALRTRFKATVFRNLAGTTQMYMAVAQQTLANPTDTSSLAVTQVNVIGPRKTWVEQVQVVSGHATSTITDAAYIYVDSVFFGANINDGTNTGDLLVPGADHDYTISINNAAVPATLTINAVGTNTPDGTYDLQFDYVSKYSRNDPFGQRWSTGGFVSNRIDIWVNGLVGAKATQACVMSTNALSTFNGTVGSPMQNTNYQLLNGSNPVIGDFFTALVLGPVISVPATITAGGTTYTLGTDYDVVFRADAFGRSPTSASGIVWHTVAQPNKAAPKHPNNAVPFTVTNYIYNTVPNGVQQTLQSTWRLLGTDAQVHAGIPVYYRFHLAVVYNRGVSTATVNSDIDAALRTLVAGLGFNSALQVSDVLQAVHNVSGVDNVRFLTVSDDGANYGMQVIYSDGTAGTVSQVGGRTADVYFNDATYPMVWDERIIVKAHNTFGVS